MLLNTAHSVISFLHSTKYRLIDVRSINRILQENHENSLFKEFIKAIFLASFPTYPTFSSVKEMIQSKDKENPIHWFSVDFNMQFEDNSDVNNRFFNLMKVTDGNYQKVFYNQSISAEEAYFYLDMFRGCKFGLSYTQVRDYLLEEELFVCKTHFKEPIYFEDRISCEEFPVICQPSLKGFHFIAKIFDGNYQVTRSDSQILTAKFGILRKISQFMPKDKKIMIDFIVQPKDMSPKGMSLLENQLNSDEPIKKANLIILDFFCKGDSAILSKRLKRIKRLVERCYSINMSSIICVPYKIIDSQEKLDVFVEKNLSKRGTIFVKNDGFYREKPYKVTRQFNNESMLIEDYSIKQTNLLNKRNISIDTIICKNGLGEIVPVKNWSNMIEQSIFNLVGKHVKIRWEDDSNGEHYPYIFGIDKYKKIENMR